MHLKMPCAKWWPFGTGDELKKPDVTFTLTMKNKINVNAIKTLFFFNHGYMHTGIHNYHDVYVLYGNYRSERQIDPRLYCCWHPQIARQHFSSTRHHPCHIILDSTYLLFFLNNLFGKDFYCLLLPAIIFRIALICILISIVTTPGKRVQWTFIFLLYTKRYTETVFYIRVVNFGMNCQIL